MERRSPRRLQDSMSTSRIASNVIQSAAVSVKLIVPTRLHENFTHCVENNAVSSGRRETHNAPTRQCGYFTHCAKHSAVGAVAEMKIIQESLLSLWNFYLYSNVTI